MQYSTEDTTRLKQQHASCRFVSSVITLGALVVAIALGGCGDSAESTGESVTLEQALPTQYSHNFSVAPEGDTSWEVTAVAHTRYDHVVAAGWFDEGSLSFGGSSSLVNDPGTGRDSFLVVLDKSGNFVWQHSWGDGSSMDPFDYQVNDVAIAPSGKIIVAENLRSCPYQGNCNWNNNIRQYSLASPTLEWLGHISPGQSGIQNVISSVAASNGEIVAGGYHEGSFTHGSDTVSAPTTAESYEAYVLKWGSYDSQTGTRPAEWVHSFGGDDDHGVADVAVDSGGNVAILGFYYDEFTDLNGDPGNDASNDQRYAFLQTVDSQGAHIDAVTSEGTSSVTDDHVPTGAVFSPNDELYVTGHFYGLFDGMVEFPLQSGPSTDLRSFFVVKYDDASSISSTAWERASDDGDNVGDYSYGIDASNTHVAITGKNSECDPNDGCESEGFGLVMDASNPSFNDFFNGGVIYTVTFGDMDREDYGNSAALDSHERAIFGGRVTTEKVDFGGGQRPGGNGFVASYSYTP